MRKLWIDLPAFAPDYSGICSAFYELGGITVIHDASGCTGNYTGYDEPRWYGHESRVFCSGLREIDAVLGRDDKLIGDILYAVKDLSPTMITVLGSPVPMVIGTDMSGIACELEKRSGLPAFGFDTNGLSLYNKGVSAAMKALAERFVEKTEDRIAGGINILGLTPLDFGTGGNARSLIQWVFDNGFVLCSSWMMETSLDQIKEAGRAKVNLVVAESGMETARWMERKLGIPYVAALPLCDGKAATLLLEQTMEDGKSRCLKDRGEEGDILIVAEQMLANAIRHEILMRFPERKAVVGTMFGLRPELASPQDLNLLAEEDLRKALSFGRFRCLVGDPLFEQLILPEKPMRFIELPHVAVSSKMYWDKIPLYIGEEMSRVLQKIL